MPKSERKNNKNAHPLDERDYALLSIVQEDCTKTAVDLSEELSKMGLGLKSAACGNRITALQANGYIKKNCAILDPKKFGLYQLCFMIVKMRSQDGESTQKFLSAALRENVVLEIYEMTGLCDYLMKVIVVNVAEATKLSQKLSQGIADIQTYPAGGTAKETTAIRLHQPSD